MTDVTLREVEPADAEVFYEHQRDPDAVHMAAFTVADPDDREAYLARFARILAADDVVKRTVLCDGRVAGHLMVSGPPEEREVTYWIAREYWGLGVATTALSALLEQYRERPLYARVAKGNTGSLRVLLRCGFVHYGEGSGYAHGRGTTVEEDLLVLRAG